MSNLKNRSRRRFLKETALGSIAVTIGGVLPGFSARSYSSIPGANERLSIGMMGVHGRGRALASTITMQPNCRITSVSDVDTRAAQTCISEIEKLQGHTPKAIPDFRNALKSSELDVLVVAAPDHWHAPAALLAMQAGLNVYLEKPCSHNPAEGELLVAAQKKYGKVLQMGNQRRSWPNVMSGIHALHNGLLGNVYYARTWYANSRKPIGTGKVAAVPSWLNYDLWQGPAPRLPYKDNRIHYNWHWFWHWGTGEALNNGTHMVDLARWGLQVDYPVKVTSTGGRYFFNDDWQTPDTQVITLDYGDKGMITWEGRSANGRSSEGAPVGVVFYGEKGSLQINGDDSYRVFDLNNKLVKEVKSSIAVNTANTVNPAGVLDGFHFENMFNAIRKGTKLNSDIQSGHVSTLLVQLGNIAQRTSGVLTIDAGNGHIVDNKEAMKLWSRTYEKGWEPEI